MKDLLYVKHCFKNGSQQWTKYNPYHHRVSSLEEVMKAISKWMYAQRGYVCGEKSTARRMGEVLFYSDWVFWTQEEQMQRPRGMFNRFQKHQGIPGGDRWVRSRVWEETWSQPHGKHSKNLESRVRTFPCYCERFGVCWANQGHDLICLLWEKQSVKTQEKMREDQKDGRQFKELGQEMKVVGSRSVGGEVGKRLGSWNILKVEPTERQCGQGKWLRLLDPSGYFHQHMFLESLPLQIMLFFKKKKKASLYTFQSPQTLDLVPGSRHKIGRRWP